ncbi:MAG: serine/threonine protein kinase [Clostridia bacterium]|nr:serine/threonine protein kinase [Clostridia bacterium]
MERIRQFEPLFGDWHIESLIGAGSFGRVYKIYRDELDTRFYSALKHISIPEDEGEVNQLRIDGMDERSISTYYTELTKSITEETKLMNRLRGNTNIVSFEDSKVIPKEGGVGYDIFIRMELLTSLPARLVDAPLTEAETVRLGADICSALELCGKYGIIHRDIKPDNIFISDTGAFKLGDFGVARKLENTSGYMSKKGTYNYMAPEVYRGEKYGPRCDIYSLGLVMYRLLNNGRLPFLPAAPKMITPNDRETSLVRRMSGEAIPAPCSADDALSAIVLKACAFDQNDRYADAAQMRADLENYIARKPVSAAAQPSAAPVGYDLADGTETVAILHGTPVPPAPKPTVPPVSQQPEPVKLPKPAKQPRPEKQQPVQPVFAPQNDRPLPAKKSKKGLIIGLVAALVAVAAILGVLFGLGIIGKSSPVGTYSLTSIDGKSIRDSFKEAADSFGMTLDQYLDYQNMTADDIDNYLTLTLDEGGSGIARSMDSNSSVSLSWEQDGSKLYVTIAGVNYGLDFNGRTISGIMEGVSMVFTRK